MKNKVIPLFNKPQMIQDKGMKYSTLLEKFLEPFAKEFEDVEYVEDIFEFAIQAWNFGNLQIIGPKNEQESVLDLIDNNEINTELLKRMITYKVNHFSEYTNFIVDFEIKETQGDPVLTVATQEEKDYLESIFELMDEEDSQNDYEENYIDRIAILIKPKKPFVEWAKKIHPDDTIAENEINTYLIDENTNLENWLKKKFDKIFEIELEAWHTNKKEWPQNRTFKMFNDWFQVEISTIIYDLEKLPISKKN